MNETTRETRDAAFQRILPLAQNREERAFECLRGHYPAGLTAGEVSEETSLPLNGARSALTDLLNANRIVVIGKRLSTHKDAQQKTKVAIWALPLNDGGHRG